MLWVKSFHIVFVITWMAAIFYLPRLYVYHVQALREGDTRGSERFKVMERKLYVGIMTPSAVLAVALGLWLWLGFGIGGHWMHVKFALVLLLLAYHGLCWWHLRAFRCDGNRHSERYFRIINELPVVLLFGIVLLVVLKPF
ncbi:MAG: CopD family protein [Burkholderiales bacterium]|nr:CopD family protein [Pseudomonadota bacterium]MCC7069065.1 CopD family protein [Burkholderiales bacterium]MCZ2134401.1 CopD family protein [Burkholderiales bacterium]